MPLNEAVSDAPHLHLHLHLDVEPGSPAFDWSKGKIESKEFTTSAANAVATSLGNSACARLKKYTGSVVGSAIGGIASGVIGAFIGGINGAIAGQVVVYGIKYFLEKDEDAARAEIVIEAFHFLDLPAYESIDKSVVGSKFRKAALQCHPDTAKVQALTSEVEKAKAKFHWELLRQAKDVALSYLQGRDSFSVRCQKMIREKYDPAKRENITFDQLKASLGNNGGFEPTFYFHCPYCKLKVDNMPRRSKIYFLTILDLAIV